MFSTSIFYYYNGCGLIFVLTNHLLKSTSNFSIGHCIDQSFISVSISGWSLLDLHAIVVKTACFQ